MGESLRIFLARLADLWNRLSGSQRAVLGAAAILAFSGLVVLLSWPTKGRAAGGGDYTALFRGLEPAEAAQVVEGLKGSKIPYRIENDGHDILVPREQLYEQRMAFASQGLPRSGTIGYEIFDKSQLGMTDFVQNMNYRRALEGEMVRTITTISEIENARVHLSIPKPTLFTDKEIPPTASVVLKLKRGADLDKKTVQGIAQLVASSVEGLKPGQVTIIDQTGRVLARGGGDRAGAQMSEANNEVRQQVEGYLRTKVADLLDRVVGGGRYEVQVAVDMDYDQIEKTVETFNPESKVVRSEQREDEAIQNSETEGDVTREKMTANYEIDRTVMKVISAPGSTLRRVSVSVAVDGSWEKGEDGKQAWKARTPEEITQLSELVRGAVGAQAGTEDNVFVTCVKFDNSLVADAVLEMEKKPVPWQDYFRWGVLALVVVAGFVLLRGLVRALVEAMNPPSPDYPELAIETSAEVAAGASRMNDLLQRVESISRAEPDNMSKLVRTWLQDGSGNKPAKPGKGR